MATDDDGGPGPVLVGIDDLAHSWPAADWAAAEAETRGCAVRVVHAVGPSADTAYGETGVGLTDQVLRAAFGVLDDVRARVAAARPGLPIDTVLAREDPGDALLGAAQDADLVVVGTRGRGGFAELLLGSVSRRVAAHAGLPVVVVRGETGSGAREGIVVGVRDDRDEEAVRFALAEAELRGTRVRLLHAWTPLADRGPVVSGFDDAEAEREAHVQLLNHAARPVAEHPEVHVETEVTVGSAAAALVEASARADLLVLPRHPVESRLGLRLGTVVHAVLHHASCPVAVVPVG
ncbi:universal stress protein [Streptomyces sp. NPDC018693]|uniref:universal stress protein n=1 Tax=unclassified Streptomyces TaxID=2593676 RepID=UPI00379E58A2